MLPLLAEIHNQEEVGDQRGSARRTVRLEVGVSSSNGNALIHNLSQTGLLMQTDADLEVGDRIEIDLPEAGPTAAHVIWTRSEFVGCEFAAPVSRGALSAALLKAPSKPAPAPQTAPRALWSDLEGSAEPAPVASGGPQLAAGLAVSLAIALSFAVALISFPFAA